MQNNLNGIIIIDKPAGWTSHDVVAKIRGALRSELRKAVSGAGGGKKDIKVGHGGTLDPMATGVLPVFIGRATRAAEFCENAEKEYVAGLKLGIVTDTQDITGEIIHSCEASFSPGDIQAVIPRFIGAQKQTPPMYSAVKIGGKKLYELARGGVEVPRPERDIAILSIELLDGADGLFTLKVACSKGTYIRTLCNDIGAALGCGGTMSSLRRTRAGAFTIDMASPLDSVLDSISSGRLESGSLLMPIDALFSRFLAVTLSERDAFKCKHGLQCKVERITDGTYRFYGPDNEFLLLGDVISGEIKAIKRFFEV